MEQFLLIALAHFLALLSPGPDFFLLARTSASAGWRVASGACLGIAAANGLFILASFAGVSALQAGSTLFVALQLAGCAYLLYLGQLFLRHAGTTRLDASENGGAAVGNWRASFAMGLLSALFNPKNALFYASLASMLASSALWLKALYGGWMFSAVLAWDLVVAVAIGNQRVLRRFARALPWLERASGVMLIALASGVLIHLVRG